MTDGGGGCQILPLSQSGYVGFEFMLQQTFGA